MKDESYIHRIRAGMSERDARQVAMRIEYHLGVPVGLSSPANHHEWWYVDFKGPRHIDLDFLRPDVLPPIEQRQTPTAEAQIANAIENGELLIEKAKEEIAQLDVGRYGRDEFHYDHGYAQGKKDAARIILLSIRCDIRAT